MIKPAMTASFHIGLLPDRPVAAIAEIVAEAERLGFAGAWIADSQSIFRDGYAALTLAASRTSSIALASGVTNPLTRHPAVIASSLATLHEQSGGRAIIGIGIGESAVHTVGLRPARLRRLEQAAVAIRALARGEEAELDGGRLRLTWADSAIPLYLASSGPKSLQLAGRIADGVLFQVGAEPALVSYAIRNIREGMAAAGRPAGSVRLLARLACSVAADREWARREVRGYVAAAAGTTFAAVPREELPPALADDIRALKERYDYYQHASAGAWHEQLVTDRIVDSISVSGTPEEAVPRLRELVALGVEGFVVPITSSDPSSSMRALVEHVIPVVNG